jgi:DNA recombination protein RmuC
MEALIVVLLVVLIGAVLFAATRMGRGEQSSAAPAPTTVVAPPVDIAPIIAAVKESIDIAAISTGVKGAVEAQMLTTAQQALAANNAQVADQAAQTLNHQQDALDARTRELLQPFQEKINALAEQVGHLKTSYDSEKGTITQLASQLGGLQETTTSLRNALKSPTARGSWGENQLRNVIRLAGMENYCDFTEQFTGTENERNQRPDVVINLPTGGRIAVDSKAPLSAYLRMQDASDVATQEAELKQHAKDLKAHAKTLADKKYWDQFGHNTPDFVVMFIPGEGFVADAMKADTNLMAEAMQSRVLIASPVNLLALLLTIAKGWQSHRLNEQAEEVAKLGSDLYDRVGKVIDEVVKMGRAIGTTNTAYNAMVASLESRLLVTLRRFKELGVVQENAPISQLSQVESTPRTLMSPEAQQLPFGDQD